MPSNDPNVALLEAFAGRGQGDFLFSHDLGERLGALLAKLAFIEALPGDAASQERLPDLEDKLRRIVGLASS